MFPNRYFAPRYFAPRFWPGGAEASPPATTSTNVLPMRLAYYDRLAMPIGTFDSAVVVGIELRYSNVIAVTIAFEPTVHMQITTINVISIWMNEQ